MIVKDALNRDVKIELEKRLDLIYVSYGIVLETGEELEESDLEELYESHWSDINTAYYEKTCGAVEWPWD